MMGSRALLLTFGYAYPAYKCFKIVETKTHRIDQLLFWCQYWIIVALVTALEPIGDVSLSCLPLYGEAKLAFFIYLWHQETKGAIDIYNRLFRDGLSNHEAEIDLKLMEIKAVLVNVAVSLWNKVIGYGPETRPKLDEGCHTLMGTQENVVNSHDSTAIGNGRWSAFRYVRQRMSCCGMKG